MDDVIAVTGSTGAVGNRVALALAAAGVRQRLVGRDPSRLPQLAGAEHGAPAQYRDTEAMRRALDGASTLFLVSGRESADRLVEHRSAVDAAVAAGVGRIVYLSFLSAAPDCTFTFGRDHWHTEQHIRERSQQDGLRFTFLRDSFYAAMLPALADAEGVIRGPAGDGRVSAVTHDDVADVAVAVLLDGHGTARSAHDGEAYPVTGPEAITLAEAAEQITAATGRRVTYQPETVEEAYASRAHYGAPDFEVAGWVTSYVAIANGELEQVSDTVPRLTGHPARSFAEFLRTR
ncbi:MAG TPA: NmrA family NAD(P)-binding protein [Actinomycetales bacterium]|nr:NmrA family NAD(P)-binding protein [Actinomycetales bacterium]